MTDVIVIGAGPAGALGALCAADLGARTTLVASAEFGGMAGNDGTVPVRTLSQAARLIREARQLGRYGVGVSEPVLDYARLLARVREVVSDVRAHIAVRQRIDAVGVTVHEHAGTARFADPHTVVTESGLRLQADKIIICTGGVSRRLPIPGFALTSTHSDAWTRAASGISHFDALLEEAAAKASARQLVTIDDVGSATDALAGDGARLITGDIIYVDGGLHIVS